jgi:hypothetical protein
LDSSVVFLDGVVVDAAQVVGHGGQVASTSCERSVPALNNVGACFDMKSNVTTVFQNSMARSSRFCS